MSDRLTITIRNASDNERAAALANKVAYGTRIEFKGETGTDPQRRIMWAMCNDFSEQLPWHGRMLSAEGWKLLFLAALKRELKQQMDIVPNLEGDGFVDLSSRSSSDLSKSEKSDMIVLMQAFGANHNVKFHDPDSSDAFNSSGMGERTDTPADSVRPPAQEPAGVPHSKLPPEWRDSYLSVVASPVYRDIKLTDLHARAIQRLGAEPSVRELSLMGIMLRTVQDLRKSRIPLRVYDDRIETLRTIPLDRLQEVA